MILRTVIAILIFLAVGAGAFWLFAPREPVDTQTSFDASAVGVDDPDRFLAQEEANIPNLRPGAAKQIVWAYPASRARTPIAVVYIHGFSADKHETRPLADEVAKALGANLFYTRLTGHGRDSAALEQATVNDWLNDLAEATAIGRAIGNRVVVIAASTGGTLASFGASLENRDPDLMKAVEGIAMISPNFGVNDRWAFLLDMPYAREILPVIAGKNWGFQPLNDAMAANWTTTYPIGALVPMAALVRATLASDLSAIDTPALVFFSPNDKVVDPAATRAAMARWGAPHRLVEIDDDGDPSHHTLAGDIVSPATTGKIAAAITDWVKGLQDAR